MQLFRNAVLVTNRQPIAFKCRACGVCCKNVRDSIVLEPLDAYRIVRDKQKNGCTDSADDILWNMAELKELSPGFHVFVLRTVNDSGMCGIECSHGKIIFDCGWHRNMSPDGVFDKKAQIKSLGSLPLYVTNQGRIEKGLAIDEQLAALGIHPADLDLVLLSHLDCDHTNGLNLVADAKQILVSKDELLFAENKTPVNRIRYNADWWRSTKMQTFDWNGTEGLAGKSYDVFGDESLVMVNIPGHSKGLCALKITGSDGRFILLLRRWRLRPKIVGAADHIRHCR